MCKCRYEGPEGTRLKMMQISRAVLTRQLCNLKPYRTFDSARIKQTQVHRASPSSQPTTRNSHALLLESVVALELCPRLGRSFLSLLVSYAFVCSAPSSSHPRLASAGRLAAVLDE